MSSKSQRHKNAGYYEALGIDTGMPSYMDFYRFKFVKRNLKGSSILDVGVGKGDFLNLIKAGHQVSGTEVNGKAVEYCNQVLGREAVKLGNLDTGLDYKDNSFDTVTCMEVLEHLEDPKKAIAELVRVSAKRVIITVPFDETLQQVLCIHCAQYTPVSAHMNSFNRKTIRDIIPGNVTIIKTSLIGNKGLRLFPSIGSLVYKSPFFVSHLLDGLANLVLPRATWMMVIMDKKAFTGKRP